MHREEIEKLLGGYATGTLTESERKSLFEAALADQALFNALANEQALKDLLDDRRARRRLLQALEERPGLFARLLGWLTRPAPLALAGGLATAVLAVTTVTRVLDLAPPPEQAAEEASGLLAERDRPAAPKAAPERRAGALKKEAKAKADHARDQSSPAALADTMQEKPAAERQAEPATSPAPSSTPPVAASQDAGPGKAAPEAPVANLLARSEVARSDAPGARSLFYGTRKKEEAPARERQPAESKFPSSAAPREQVAGGASPRLGIRYGTVSREEGRALVVEVNQRGYLYAVSREASGTMTLVYPAPASDPQVALVEPGARYFIPPMGALPASRVTVVLSRTPLDDPMVLAGTAPPEKQGILLRQDTMEPPLEGTDGPTVYVVEAAPSFSSILSVEIPAPAR